jgi:hypothetical protein
MSRPVVASRTPLAAGVAAGSRCSRCAGGRSRRRQCRDGLHQHGRCTAPRYRAAAGGTLGLRRARRGRTAPRRDGTHRTR